MNKSDIKDLARQLSEQYELSKEDAEKFVEQMFVVLNEGLHYDKQVKVKGLGTFKVMSVAPRKSVNVQTGEPIIIEGREKISFTPDASMRDAVNRPFAQFETVVLNEDVDFTAIDKKYEDGVPEEDMPAETTPEATEDPGSVVMPVVPDETSADGKTVEEVPEISPSTPEADAEKEQPEEDVAEPETEMPGEPAVKAEPVTVEAEPEKAPSESESMAGTVAEKAEDVESARDEEVAGSESAATEPEPETLESKSATMEPEAAVTTSEVNRKTTNVPEEPEQNVVQKPVSEAATADLAANELLKEIHHNKRLIRWLGVAVIALLVVFAGVTGYFYLELSRRDNRIQHLEFSTAVMSSHKILGHRSVDSAAMAKSKADSARIARPAKTVKAVEAAQEKAELRQKEVVSGPASVKTNGQATSATKAKTKDKAKADVKAAKSDAASSAYDKDPRIRTGAYRIVGIDHTVTVKAGQTLSSISRTALGPGMECYVEAVNGGRTEFKAGEKIKIPALKHKKAK